MKTLYVTIPDDILDKLIETYKNADPVTESHAFSIYLALGELKRSRKELAAAVKAIETILHDEGEYCEEHCKTPDCTGCVKASLFEWRGVEEGEESQ